MAADNETRPTRKYRSAVREASARRTRRAIVNAARDLFVERGYAGASLADVAVVAGVARPTVFAAFGSKPALLRQVLDEALAGDDEPVSVVERPWYQPVRLADTAEGVLDAYAEVCRLIGGRTARIFETVRQAADDAEEVAQVWETLLRNRRIGATGVVGRLRDLGPLRYGSDLDRSVDLVWFYNDPAHYGSLVLRCGWSETDFRDWLASQLKHAVLPGR